MNQITAKVIADSVNESKTRLTTMVVTFPRYILAEFNTHRAFSRNSASSRAIPFETMLETIQSNPFIPMAWQKNHSGMQGAEYLSERDVEVCNSAWLVARNRAVDQAKHIAERGATKQMINRILEPYMWTTVIVTATDFQNFFKLRCPRYWLYAGKESNLRYKSKKEAMNHFEKIKDTLSGYDEVKNFTDLDWLKFNDGQADIHMMALAEVMYDAYNESVPKELKSGEWHIPFRDKMQEDEVFQIVKDNNLRGEYEYPEHNWKYEEVRLKIATAQCARVSYTTIGKEKVVDYQKDIDLHDYLLKARHASPFEHSAVVDPSSFSSRNFGAGWTQYREIVERQVPLNSFH